MESSLRRTEKTYSRLILGLLLGLVFVVTLCWAGYQAYARWQEHRYMHQAHAAFDKDDLRWAALGARCAFEWRSDSLDACRLLGEIGDRQMSNEAIDWRRRAVDIAPASVPDLVKLAETALRFGRLQLADETLARVPPEKQRDPAYQTAAANMALAKNDSAGALKHLTEAARLAPHDLQRQLALAEFELRSDDSVRREDGRKLANQLRTNPKARASALEILLVDALRSARPGKGITLARELSAMPDAPFTARLRALTAFRVFNDPDFVNVLERLQTEAHDSVEKAVALVNWMNSQNLALLAIDWSRRLPERVVNTLAMHAALADSFIVMRDWKSLANLLKTGSWTSAESLRFALQAKVARETGDDPGHEKNWAMAVEKAGSDRVRLEVLQRLASQWNWPAKAAGVLWQLADNPQAQRDALQALYRYYREIRDSSQLYRVLLRLDKLMPEDNSVQNNLAQLSLLLNAEPAKARGMAKQLYEKEPGNPAYASTYAFALYQGGDTSGALKIMQQLTPAQLNDPPIAAYYGVILAASKQKHEAQKYLDLGAKAVLLPEEEALVARARDELARG